MHVLTAPEPFRFQQPGPRVFLAGGITGCPDWQTEVIDQLQDATLAGVLFNPRRPNFPIHDTKAAEGQINWEWRHLGLADIIVFWFPQETLCPIVLFEYGKMLGRGRAKHLIIGAHPNYARRQDLVIQTYLEDADLTVVDTLAHVVEQLQDVCTEAAHYRS
jgi:Nucleoside 2-deoxyribosyltransferase like